MMRLQVPPGTMAAMVKTARKKLHALRVDVRAGRFLARKLTPQLVAGFMESRKRKIAVYTVGGAAAGLATARLALHRLRTDTA
jgi:hypothetical protein